MSAAVTVRDLAELPPTLDLVTAANILGVGRTLAYTLARAGRFPCPVLRIGGSYRVPTPGLLALLGLDADTASQRDSTAMPIEPPGGLDGAASAERGSTPTDQRIPAPPRHPAGVGMTGSAHHRPTTTNP